MSRDSPQKAAVIQNCSAKGPSTTRLSALEKYFNSIFSQEPDFYVRVPGRVNLIGEHVDYCGYSVCPMAIQNDILIAVKKSEEGKLKIVNVDPAYRTPYNGTTNNIKIQVKAGEAPDWFSYVLCGVKGVLEDFPAGRKPVGCLLAVNGNIPPASGVSSSSALVCAAAMAAAHANELDMSREELATLCARAERYIGTEGGGMDQAICLLANRGSAKHIKFNPLKTEDVQLPANSVFVIANSLTTLNKAETGCYNTRVAECRLATQVMAKFRGVPGHRVSLLAELQDYLGISLHQMLDLAKEALLEVPYTKKEICSVLEVTEAQLNKQYIPNNILHIDTFKLRNRALHVLQEALRVETFVTLCSQDISAELALKRLGELMGQSHVSLETLYECSHPELDRLVALSKGSALGCRLTGAGWGGCVVALTTTSTADAYIAMLKEKFYKGHPSVGNRDLDSLVFATEPSGGAEVIPA
ncbi:N-acetylgalactosamine kinase [Bacillus rossius redtenbacheri]|uniref:N-acetylgalactosamine kinase n=1 Tax=Bacillus rossius redtenbacheri TaxID=93214 RepID=UPI002FDC7EC7